MDSRPCIGGAAGDFMVSVHSWGLGLAFSHTDHGPHTRMVRSHHHHHYHHLISEEALFGVTVFISGSIHRFPSYNCITRLIAHATYRGGM